MPDIIHKFILLISVNALDIALHKLIVALYELDIASNEVFRYNKLLYWLLLYSNMTFYG